MASTSSGSSFDITTATGNITSEEQTIQNALNQGSNLSTTDLLQVQQQISAETLAVSVVTNCMKEQSDAAKNITANYR